MKHIQKFESFISEKTGFSTKPQKQVARFSVTTKFRTFNVSLQIKDDEESYWKVADVVDQTMRDIYYESDEKQIPLPPTRKEQDLDFDYVYGGEWNFDKDFATTEFVMQFNVDEDLEKLTDWLVNLCYPYLKTELESRGWTVSSIKEIENGDVINPDGSVAENTNLVEKDEDDPCWKGYKMVGMKKKGKKKVPNCVPENAVYDYENFMKKQKVNELLVSDNKKIKELITKVKKVVKDSAVIRKIEELIASAVIDPYADYKSIASDLLRTFPQVFGKEKELQLALESLQEL